MRGMVERLARSLEMKLPADVGRLAELRAFVRRSSADLDVGRHATNDIVQAVDECATNVIVHGYRGAGGELRVEVERVDDELIVRLSDRAPAFDPTSVPEPDLELPLERRPPGGMGVYLARRLTDAMQYRRTRAGNELTLIKGITEGSQHADDQR